MCVCVCAVFPCQSVCVSLLQQPQSAVMPVLPLPVLLQASRRALGCGGVGLGQSWEEAGIPVHSKLLGAGFSNEILFLHRLTENRA